MLPVAAAAINTTAMIAGSGEPELLLGGFDDDAVRSTIRAEPGFVVVVVCLFFPFFCFAAAAALVSAAAVFVVVEVVSFRTTPPPPAVAEAASPTFGNVGLVAGWPAAVPPVDPAIGVDPDGFGGCVVGGAGRGNAVGLIRGRALLPNAHASIVPAGGVRPVAPVSA